MNQKTAKLLRKHALLNEGFGHKKLVKRWWKASPKSARGSIRKNIKAGL
jgi:hypothetical protein